MSRISVLIPDADVRLNVACCLTASKQAVVHGLALNPAPLQKHSRFFASFEESNGKFDVNSWLSRLGEIVEKRNCDVVLPISDFAIRTLSEHHRTLNWSGKLSQLPNSHTFDIATDKGKLADFLNRYGVPHPPTTVVTAGPSAQEKLSAIEFPVVVKPPRSTRGIGISRFEDLESLTTFLAKQPGDTRWIVQTFIEGRDLGINVLCRDGRILAATVQHTIRASSKPFQTATGIEFRDEPSAMNVVERLIRELGWSGVANIDMRIDARAKIPYVLELNGRFWYSLLGSLNAGVNFPLLACEMCLGEVKSNRKPHNARYFSGKESSLLSLIGGGSLRIRPHETNLRYFDPVPDSLRLAKGVAASLTVPFSRMLPRFKGGSV